MVGTLNNSDYRYYPKMAFFGVKRNKGDERINNQVGRIISFIINR